MAETVKKSRIVSDEDNLEESLMEEFNLRLKNCMSQDSIHQEEQVEEVSEEIVYENVEVVKTNGKMTEHITVISTKSENGITSQKFIEIEKENYYETVSNGLKQNGHEEPQEKAKTQQEETELETNTSTSEQYGTKPDILEAVVGKDEVDESEVIYENIENPKFELDITEATTPEKPKLTLPTTCLIASESLDLDNPDHKSVKDRMFLSTDDTSCLLFTQTVTSPMLTPSEENIDFLKGFRRQSSQNTNSSSSTSNKVEEDIGSSEVFEKVDVDTSESDKIDVISDNLEDDGGNKEIPEEKIYENLPPQENLYENIESTQAVQTAKSESIYENIDVLKGHLDVKLETEKFIEQEVYELEKSGDLSTDFKEDVSEDLKEDSMNAISEDFNADVSADLKVEDFIEDVIEDLKAEDFIEDDTNRDASTEIKVNVSSEDSVNIQSTRYSEIVSEKMKKFEEIIHKTDELPVSTSLTKPVISPTQNIQNLKSVFMKSESETVSSTEKHEFTELKTLDVMKHIHKFENISPSEDSNSSSEMTTETTTTYVETIETKSLQDKSLKKKKSKKKSSHEKENISVSETNTNKADDCHYNVNVKSLCRSFGDLTKIDSEKYHNEKNKDERKMKSSFNKFDALQKKNILHVRSSDSSKAQDKFNGAQQDGTNCKACDKQVFQMELIKAEKASWHKNCFRCKECNKQLTVDTYQSHEGNLYCKPHFKSLFAPKVVEDDAPASDKPDLGLEELHSLNVKERFQVFENHEENVEQVERNPVNVKRSATILSKLARFQAKGMDIGVTDDSLNGIPIDESESEEEVEEEEIEGEDADLVRARRAQREKPFHFTGMSDVKNKWEQGETQHAKDERREERKQEIQSIRNRLFMGKQGKMKELYQQAVMESESGANVKKCMAIEVTDTRTLKEKFEKGEGFEDHKHNQEAGEDMSVFESGISKKSRSIFLELDANASKPPQLSPVTPPKVTTDIRRVKEVFTNRQVSDDVVKSSEQVDDVVIQTSDIQQKFKFFETYKEPEKQRKQFRITPPREGQVKAPTPEREIYRDPDIVRSEEYVEDSVVAKERHTATKMLNKFRQMEENLNKEQSLAGPKPLKRFTPPPEPSKSESSSGEEYSGSEEEEEGEDELDHHKYSDAELVEAHKAARAKQLRAKFERWEANEIKREQNNSSVNIAEEIGDEQSIESTKALRARFESMRETSKDVNRSPKVKVNRFVDTTKCTEICESCKGRVYPLEKISVHNSIFHKNCFKCKECNAILRMDSYSYNQGLLYCTPHFKRLFISKGNYDTAFGLEQHKEKWNTTVA